MTHKQQPVFALLFTFVTFSVIQGFSFNKATQLENFQKITSNIVTPQIKNHEQSDKNPDDNLMKNTNPYYNYNTKFENNIKQHGNKIEDNDQHKEHLTPYENNSDTNKEYYQQGHDEYKPSIESNNDP